MRSTFLMFIAATSVAIAQDTPPLQSSSPTVGYSMEEKLATRTAHVDSFLTLLGTITDQASADAAVGEAAELMKCLLDDSNGIPLQSVDQQKAQIYFDKLMQMQELVQKIASEHFYGSEPLAALFKDAQSAAVAQIRSGRGGTSAQESRAAYVASMKACSRLLELLSSINDKNSADRVSSVIGDALIDMRTARATSFESGNLTDGEIAAFNELVAKVQNAFMELVKVDFYGSQCFIDSMNQALASIESPGLAPLPDEVWSRAFPAIQELNQEMNAILAQVKDKQSAAAAAGQIRALLPRHKAVADMMRGYENCAPTPEQAEALDQLRAETARVMVPLYEQKFFDSTELRDALNATAQ